jgi:hypothetical protein
VVQVRTGLHGWGITPAGPRRPYLTPRAEVSDHGAGARCDRGGSRTGAGGPA